MSLIHETYDLPEEIRPLPPPDLSAARFPLIIDNSQIGDFRKCPERWFEKYCRRITLIDSNVHLVSGGAYAKGVEVTRKLFWDDNLPMREALRAGMRAAIRYYGAFEPHGKHWGKNIWRVLGAMEWHFNKWPIDKGIVPFLPAGSLKHAIEFSFAEPLPIANPDNGEPLIYAGKCDMIGQDLAAGILGPVDDKTTTQLGDYWLARWDMSSQMFGYIWAAKRAYPEYAHLIQCAFIRGVSILKTKYGEADARCYAREDQLDKWYQNTLQTLGRMVETYTRLRDHAIPPEKAWGDACSDFGGCAFKMLCESENPEVWIPVHFTENTWNPLESRD
jgi:hypothetical protein